MRQEKHIGKKDEDGKDSKNLKKERSKSRMRKNWNKIQRRKIEQYLRRGIKAKETKSKKKQEIDMTDKKVKGEKEWP